MNLIQKNYMSYALYMLTLSTATLGVLETQLTNAEKMKYIGVEFACCVMIDTICYCTEQTSLEAQYFAHISVAFTLSRACIVHFCIFIDNLIDFLINYNI